MTKEERLELQNDIFKYFLDTSIILTKKDMSYTFSKKKKSIDDIIQDNITIKYKYDKYINEYRSKEEALWCLINRKDLSEYICPCCNKNIKEFYIKKDGGGKYRKSCGNKDCLKKLMFSEEIQEKVKKTNKERYGSESPFGSNIIKEKIKKTNLDRYGTEYGFQRKEIQEKAKKTIKERYGEDNVLKIKSFREKGKATLKEKYGSEIPINSDIIRDKMKETNIKRYGVEYVLQSKDIQDRIKKTNKTNFGVDYPMQNKEIQDKTKKTCLDKYGVEYVSQVEEFKNKQQDTMESKYGVRHALQNEQFKNKAKETNLQNCGREYHHQQHITNYDIWIDDKRFKEYIIDRYNKKGMFLKLCDINTFFNVCPENVKRRVIEVDALNYFHIQSSSLELNFESLLKSYNIVYERNNRSILLNSLTGFYLEIDFYIKDYNIGIEINDISTHNSLNPSLHTYKDPSYHLNKTLLARDQDIRLIHIWEWELRNTNEWDKVSRWLLDLFNTNKYNIYSSMCEYKIVDNTIEEKEFLDNYNLYGYTKSDICIGLYYNNKLIQLMSFKKSSNTNYTLELLRYSTKYGYIVKNGYRLLFDNILKSDSSIEGIVGYLDISKETNEVYTELGFSKINDVIDPRVILCNKDLDHFIDTTSTNEYEYNDLIDLGYIPIYDCGLEVYRYTNE